MEENKTILYKEDLLKKLAEQTGKDYDVLEEMVNINLKYIRDTALTGDDVIIKIPKLCKIYANYQLHLGSYWQMFRKRSKNRKVTSVKSKYLKLKEILDNEDNPLEKCFMTPNMLFYYAKIYREMPKLPIKNYFYIWSKIADYHNEKHQKYFNND